MYIEVYHHLTYSAKKLRSYLLISKKKIQMILPKILENEDSYVE